MTFCKTGNERSSEIEPVKAKTHSSSSATSKIEAVEKQDEVSYEGI